MNKLYLHIFSKGYRTMASAGWQGAPYFRRFVCKGLSNDGVGGVARGTVFQEIRPEAGFKTGDSVKEKLGGYRKTGFFKANWLL